MRKRIVQATQTAITEAGVYQQRSHTVAIAMQGGQAELVNCLA